MRASQHIPVVKNKRLTPAQRRLNAGSSSNRQGIRKSARRSALPRARKMDVAAAFIGSSLILALALALLNL